MTKDFYRYIRDRKSVLSIAVIIALGLILIFIGGNESNEASDDTVGIEDRLSAACSAIAGVGDCSVLVYYGAGEGEGEGQIESVIVICDGVDSSEVRLKLTKMLSSFLGIGSNRIRIERKK